MVYVDFHRLGPPADSGAPRASPALHVVVPRSFDSLHSLRIVVSEAVGRVEPRLRSGRPLDTLQATSRARVARPRPGPESRGRNHCSALTRAACAAGQSPRTAAQRPRDPPPAPPLP